MHNCYQHTKTPTRANGWSHNSGRANAVCLIPPSPSQHIPTDTHKQASLSSSLTAEDAALLSPDLIYLHLKQVKKLLMQPDCPPWIDLLWLHKLDLTPLSCCDMRVRSVVPCAFGFFCSNEIYIYKLKLVKAGHLTNATANKLDGKNELCSHTSKEMLICQCNTGKQEQLLHRYLNNLRDIYSSTVWRTLFMKV